MISQIVTFVEIIIETKGKIQVRDTGYWVYLCCGGHEEGNEMI